MEEDITKTGPVGLKGLQGVNTKRRYSDEEMQQFYDNNRATTIAQRSREYSPYQGPIGLAMDTEYGNSRYDKNVTSLSDIGRLNEIRAQSQSGIAKLGAGALKMLTTVGTTFLDDTLGLIYGLGSGIANINTEKGFWRSVWDNEFTNAMADIQEKMEEIAPNYISEWEQNASVFEKMFSSVGAANFWGNSVLKNAGFTLGSAAAIMATAGLGEITGVSKVLQGLGKFGKFTSMTAKDLIASTGEASLEALNATRDTNRLIDQNLIQRQQYVQSIIDQEYLQNIQNGMSPVEAYNIKNNKSLQLEQDIEAYKQEAQKQLTDAGNTIFAANIAVLMVSNYLSLGSLIKGGYGNATNLFNKMNKVVGKDIVTNTIDAGKALAKDELKYAAKPIKNAGLKVAGRWLAGATQEGFEEGIQGELSTTSILQTQAKMNRWARKNSMLGSMINPDAEEELSDYSVAMSKAFQEQFGALNSQGWEEVMAGLITGAIGIGGIHRNEQGKIRPTWQGGIKEAYGDILGETKAVQRQADIINNAISSQKFSENARHAIEQLAIKSKQDEALQNKDILQYKNQEIQQSVSNAIFASKVGMLDDLYAMYDQLTENISDDDLKQLKILAKDNKTGESALDGMTDEEIISLYRDKAKSTKAKIQNAVENYRNLDKQYGEAFDKYSSNIRDIAIKELTYKDSLLNDTIRRKEELQKEKEDLNQKAELSFITPSDKIRLEQINKGIEELNKQQISLTAELENYYNNPDKLAKVIENAITTAQKQTLYKEAKNAVQAYSTATILQDVLDIYSNSDETTRQQVLKQAISQATGATKTLLSQFSNYISDVNTIENFIDNEFKITDEDVAETIEEKTSYKRLYKAMLNNMVDEMLSDIDISKDNFKAKLNNLINEVQKNININKEDFSKIVEQEGNLSIDINKLTTEDIEEYLDENGISSIKPTQDAINRITDAYSMTKFNENQIDIFNKMIQALDNASVGNNSIVEEHIISPVNDKEDIEAISFEDIFEDEDESISPEMENIFDKYFKIVTVTSQITGITYNIFERNKEEIPNNIKENINNQLDSHDKEIVDILNNIAEAINNNVSEEQIKKLINNLIDALNITTITSYQLKDDIEKLITPYKQLLPKECIDKQVNPNLGKGEYDDNIANTDESLKGNYSQAYNRTELQQHRNLVSVSYNHPYLKEHSLQIQDFIDNCLNKIITKNPNTEIHYIKRNEDTLIFLGIKKSDITDIDLTNYATMSVTDEKGNIEEYIICGTLGYFPSNTDEKSLSQSSFEVINRKFEESSLPQQKDVYYTLSSITNRVKDITGGIIPISENKTQISDIATIIKKSPKDLKWGIIMEQENKFINVSDKERTLLYNLPIGEKGQVYLFIPNAKGEYIPTFIETNFFNALNQNTELFKVISDYIKTLISSKEEKSKVEAIANLKDLLIFGTNEIFYDSKNNKISYHKITSEYAEITDLNIDSEEDSYNKILKVLQELNPRVNILASLLSSQPELYVNSGILTTNIIKDRAVGASFFLYPVDNDGNFIKNKMPRRDTGNYITASKKYYYLNGQKIGFDGTYFYNSEGNRLTDQEATIMQIIVDIKNNKYIPIIIKQGTGEYTKTYEYYKVGNAIYANNGHGGFITLTKEQADYVAKRASEINTQKQKNEKLKNITDEKLNTSQQQVQQQTTDNISKTITEDKKSEKRQINSEIITNFANKINDIVETLDVENEIFDKYIKVLSSIGEESTIEDLVKHLANKGFNLSQELNNENDLELILDNILNCKK